MPSSEATERVEDLQTKLSALLYEYRDVTSWSERIQRYEHDDMHYELKSFLSGANLSGWVLVLDNSRADESLNSNIMVVTPAMQGASETTGILRRGETWMAS